VFDGLETAGVGFLPSPTQLECTRKATLPSDSVRHVLRPKALIRVLAQLDYVHRLGCAGNSNVPDWLSDQILIPKRDRVVAAFGPVAGWHACELACSGMPPFSSGR
jgi:hypothetical protein